MNTVLSAIGYILSKRFYKAPIFIVGSGRSGTSILLQSLDQHPEIISAPGESPFITSMGGSAHLFETNDTADYFRGSLKVELTYLYDQLRCMGFEISFGEYYGARFFVKRFLASNLFKTTHWCAKTFPPETVCDGLLTLYPEAKFIYAIRNGIEVVHSMTKFHGFKERDFSDQCLAWSNSVFMYEHLVGKPYAFQVRHEQLVDDPDSLYQALYQFLGVKESSLPINYIKHKWVHPLDQEDKTQVDVKQAIQSRQPSYAGWNEEQKAIFKDICETAMIKARYKMPF